jgi:hypothetical protein
LPRRHIDICRAAPISIGLLWARWQEPGLLKLWLQVRSGSKRAEAVTDAVVATHTIALSSASLGMKAPAVEHAVASRAPVILRVVVHEQTGLQLTSELLRGHRQARLDRRDGLQEVGSPSQHLRVEHCFVRD